MSYSLSSDRVHGPSPFTTNAVPHTYSTTRIRTVIRTLLFTRDRQLILDGPVMIVPSTVSVLACMVSRI